MIWKSESLTEPLAGLRWFIGNSPGDMRRQKFLAPALGDEKLSIYGFTERGESSGNSGYLLGN
jgi:hypothetical protein